MSEDPPLYIAVDGYAYVLLSHATDEMEGAIHDGLDAAAYLIENHPTVPKPIAMRAANDIRSLRPKIAQPTWMFINGELCSTGD
jgi:hypothetical protein